MTFKEVCAALRRGKFVDGGYPTFFLTSDGDRLSHEAVRENIFLVGRSMRDFGRKDGNHHYSDPAWRVIECDVNWEDPDLVCAHTYKRIPSAYAEPEESESA